MFAAMGVVVAYIVTFVTMPLCLGWFRIKPIERSQSLVDRALATFYNWCGRSATERPWRVIVVFSLLIAGCLSLFPLINVDIHPFRYFPEAAGVKQDHENILKEYGYYFPLEFTVDTHKKNGIKDPKLLAAMLRMQREAEKHPIVDHAVSLADFVHKIHVELTRGKEMGDFPSESRGVAEELFLYQMQDEEGLDLYLTPDGRVGHILFKVKFLSGNEIRDLIAHIMQLGDKQIGELADLKPVGYLPLYTKLVGYALDTQVQGFGLAFALIFGFMFVLFRNIKITAISVLPNLFPVCVIGALLAISRIDLDFGTASIAAILLGIVVDDTIHIVFSIRKELSDTPDEPKAAIQRAVAKTGHAVVTTTIILCLGFSMLMLAQSKSVLYFGFFLVFSVAGALLSDLLFLPALIYLLSRKRGAATSRGPQP
jgi:predicted RND superfamily exporter protein